MGEVQRRFGRNSREIWERFREGFVEVQQRFILRFKKFGLGFGGVCKRFGSQVGISAFLLIAKEGRYK